MKRFEVDKGNLVALFRILPFEASSVGLADGVREDIWGRERDSPRVVLSCNPIPLTAIIDSATENQLELPRIGFLNEHRFPLALADAKSSPSNT